MSNYRRDMRQLAFWGAVDLAACISGDSGSAAWWIAFSASSACAVGIAILFCRRDS